MSRVEPSKLQHIDRKSTLLLQAAQQEVRPGDGDPEMGQILDEEKREIEATEDPGMDAIGGRFSGVSGSVVRARKRSTLISCSPAFPYAILILTSCSDY